jgi:hypothetical protein
MLGGQLRRRELISKSTQANLAARHPTKIHYFNAHNYPSVPYVGNFPSQVPLQHRTSRPYIESQDVEATTHSSSQHKKYQPASEYTIFIPRRNINHNAKREESIKLLYSWMQPASSETIPYSYIKENCTPKQE